MRSASEHYDEKYFNRQKQNDLVKGLANKFKFEEFAKPGAKILDFGCASGGLLEALGGKHGVEINPHAALAAQQRGIDVRNDVSSFEGGDFDLIVSNHALEHVENPLDELKKMINVLKIDGFLVIVVPCDKPSYKFYFDGADPDFHLYSWSANNLGNLCSLAGFTIVSASEIKHSWPPKWAWVQKNIGWAGFHFFSWICGHIPRGRSQVRVVCTKTSK